MCGSVSNPPLQGFHLVKYFSLLVKSGCISQPWRHTFMETVANRVIEITPKGIIDRLMEFNEYLVVARVKALKEEMYA